MSVAAAPALTATFLDRRRTLMQLGLSFYESSVLAALADLRSGNGLEISAAAGVPRTSVYGAARNLRSLGLVDEPATVGPCRWEVGGWPAVVDRLRTRAHRTWIAHVALIDGLGQ